MINNPMFFMVSYRDLETGNISDILCSGTWDACVDRIQRFYAPDDDLWKEQFQKIEKEFTKNYRNDLSYRAIIGKKEIFTGLKYKTVEVVLDMRHFYTK